MNTTLAQRVGDKNSAANGETLISRRADKTGQERMSSCSILLLVYLSSLEANRLPWVRVMPSLKVALNISELDLQPLVQAGWVELSRGAQEKSQVSITDAGHAACRDMTAWLTAKGEEAAR